MVVPEPALAPVMPPVMVPVVHAKALGVLAVKVILELVPLQVLAVAAFVTAGTGFTVTVTAEFVAAQPTEVTVSVVAPGIVNAIILNVPMPGLPAVKLIDADCAVAVLAPLRL